MGWEDYSVGNSLYQGGVNLAGRYGGEWGGKAAGIGLGFLQPHKTLGVIAGLGKKPYQPQLLGNVTPDLYADMQRQSILSGMYNKQLQGDLAYGGRMANKLVPQGAFGQLNVQPYNDIVNRQAGRLEGYSAPEYQAMRDIQRRDDSRGYAAARENLARGQAYSGVRGATAGYQQSKLARDYNKQNIESNQKLMLENVAQRDRALKDYSGYVGQRTGVEAQNLGKKQDELGARLGAQFGYGQMGSGNRAAAAQSFANSDALNLQANMYNMQAMAQANAPKGGKKGGK